MAGMIEMSVGKCESSGWGLLKDGKRPVTSPTLRQIYTKTESSLMTTQFLGRSFFGNASRFVRLIYGESRVTLSKFKVEVFSFRFNNNFQISLLLHCRPLC